MEIFAGLSVCLLLLAALVVAIKTFLLWRRTRGLPELLLSLMLSSATVLGYPAMIASTQIPASQLWPIHVGALLLMSFGITCLLLFTLKVFRPDAFWARCLVGVALMGFTTGAIAYFLERTGEDPRPTAELLTINLINTAPIAVAYFWTTVESLTYYRRMRLRLRLGLAEAVVVNRFLLWGLMTLAAGLAVVGNLGAMLAGYFLTPSIVVGSSLLGVVHASCLFLAFHPPAWYTGWLERSDSVAVG